MRYAKFEVSSSSSFEDMFDCMPKIEGSRDLGHAPFGENLAYFYSSLPRSSSVTNLKCLCSLSRFTAITILSRVRPILTKMASAHALCHMTSR